jgi:hypothetical protein
MNNCRTKHRVMLPTSKLNSSDSQVSRTSIFLLPLQEKVTPTLFKNVMRVAKTTQGLKGMVSKNKFSLFTKAFKYK